MKKKNILKTMFSLTGVVILAKIFGFVKQMMIAGSFGTTAVTDLINLSQNFIYNIQYPLSQALFTAVASIYIALSGKAEGERERKRFLSDTLKLAMLVGAALVVVVYVVAPWISKILAPTYSQALSAELTMYLRLFSPLLLCYLWNSLFIAMLNASDRYLPSEMVSINQSIVMVTMLLFLREQLGEQILVWGFFIYTILNSVYLWSCARKRVGFSRGSPLKNENVKALIKMTGPLLLGHAALYINQMVDQSLASGQGAGAITSMGYALVLYNMVTTFIMMFCTVLFTHITTHISANEHKEAAVLTTRATLLLGMLFLPVSILAVICAEDVVAIAFGRGAFDENSVRAASQALRGYCISLAPLVVKELYARLQYGYQASKPPMVNSTVSIGVNIVLSIALSRCWGLFGITFASSISVIICAIMNAWTARRYNYHLGFRSLLKAAPLLLAAGLMCGGVAVWGLKLLKDWRPLLRFAAITVAGCAAFALVVSPILIRMLKNGILKSKGASSPVGELPANKTGEE